MTYAHTVGGEDAGALRVLLVTDEAGPSALLRSCLDALAADLSCASASTVDDALARWLDAEHDVLLIDLASLGDRAAVTLDTLARSTAEATVVAVGADELSVALQATDAGAQACLPLGDLEPDALHRCLLLAAHRQRRAAARAALGGRRRALVALGAAALEGASVEELITQSLAILHRHAPGMPVAAVTRLDGTFLLRDPAGEDAELVGATEGFIRAAIVRRAPLLVEDVTSGSRFGLADHGDVRPRSGVAVPITHGSRLAGALAIISAEVARFGDDDVAYVTQLAQIISGAAARSNAEDIARRRSHELAAVFAVGREFEVEGDPAGLASRLAEHLAATIDGRVRVSITVDGRRREAGDRLTFTARYETPINDGKGKVGSIVVAHLPSQPLTPGERAVISTVAGLFGSWLERQLAARELRRSEERFRQIAEIAPEMIYVYELAPVPGFTYVSPASEQITGYPPEAYLEDSGLLGSRMGADGREALADIATLKPGEVAEHTTSWVDPDGEQRWVRAVRVPVFEDGRLIAIHGVVSDVTVQRREQELLAHALEREIEATEQLRLTNSLKDSFLRAVSHELRTPLTSVLGYTETLRRYRDVITEEQHEEMLDGLLMNTKRLEGLLTDLLDVDRLNRGAGLLDLTASDVGAVAMATVESLGVPGRVRVDIRSAIIDIDVSKVSRIIENLVINALKHTETDVPIWVRVGPTDEGACIVVEDAGYGIDPAMRSEIFEPFAQGPASSVAPSPGTGLGLALVRQFAELHGGTVRVSDRQGGGARFVVNLPSSPTSEPQRLMPGGDELIVTRAVEQLSHAASPSEIIAIVARSVEALGGEIQPRRFVNDPGDASTFALALVPRLPPLIVQAVDEESRGRLVPALPTLLEHSRARVAWLIDDMVEPF